MTLSGDDRAVMTARAGVARSGTARAGVIGDDSTEVYTTTTADHTSGTLSYDDAADITTTFTRVAR